jgi:hypothetical protein
MRTRPGTKYPSADPFRFSGILGNKFFSTVFNLRRSVFFCLRVFLSRTALVRTYVRTVNPRFTARRRNSRLALRMHYCTFLQFFPRRFGLKIPQILWRSFNFFFAKNSWIGFAECWRLLRLPIFSWLWQMTDFLICRRYVSSSTDILSTSVF